MYSGVRRCACGSEFTEPVGLLGVGTHHQRRGLDLGVDLSEHQMREGRLELVLVGGPPDGASVRALEKTLEGTLRNADRHARHQAE